MLHTVLLLWGALVVSPPDVGGLAGQVRSADGTPIAGARVSVVEIRRTTLTDTEGRYTLTGLPNGAFRVTFAAVGYAPQLHAVVIGSDPTILDVSLKPSLIELPDIQVTAGPSGTDPLSSPQPTSVVGGEELRRSQAASLGEVIDGLVGVRSFSTGNGIAKPVIRGLTSNRVLILDDGQRVESQGWGDEHAPNVETADAERVEVIRGPASVLYGSEALGGVVNVIAKPLPDAIGRAGFLRGDLSGTFASNGSAPEGTLGLEGASGGVGFRGSFTGRTSDDVATPNGELFNSGYDMVAGTGSVGTRGTWGSLSATYSKRAESIQIHEDPAEDPTATPWQRILTDRLRVQSTLPLGGSHLDLDVGAERSYRREYEAEDAPEDDVALGLKQWNYLANAQWHHREISGFTGIIGAQFRAEDFTISGEEALIPANSADNLGVYAFEERAFGRLHLSAGLRYDRRTLDVSENVDLGVSAQNRDYTAVTGDLGLLVRLSEPVALVLNVGRGFRAPSAFDLFANGVHEGTIRFERGDSLLGNETSLNTDVALRVQSSQVAIEVGTFYNRISDFIFADPTGTTDSASGFQIYQTTQGDARLWGIEGALEWHPNSHWHLKTGADFTNGQNTTLDQPLPGIPPVRVTYEARYEGTTWHALDEPYVSLGGETNAEQTRRDPDDTATDGYSLAHLGAGAVLFSGRHPIRLDLQARNLFGQAYRGFLSRYKTYADDPGRNVIVRMSTAF
jgi:iron complex outermembrane recepter protein